MALELMYREREKYSQVLDQHIRDADNAENKGKQLHMFSEPERLRIATAVWPHPTGQNDIVYPFVTDQPQDREEVVLNLQGYVLRANLPPIMSNMQLTKNPVTAKQSLLLTGLGSELFDKSAKAIIEIHSRLANYLPPNTLEGWQPQKDEGCLCLELSNRYLTPERLATVYNAEALDETIDPLGLLKGKPGGRRTEDNVVLYYERNMGDNNEYRYTTCQPVLIKPGHIVEVQVSFCTVPISKGRYLMLSKLRSVCIIDHRIFKDLNELAFEALKTGVRTDNKKLKRKIGYGGPSANAEDTAQAMKKLHIEKGDEGASTKSVNNPMDTDD